MTTNKPYDIQSAFVAIQHPMHEDLFLHCRRPDGKWCLPGGTMEEGEQPSETAIRELEEEAGIRFNVKNLQEHGWQIFADPEQHCHVQAHLFVSIPPAETVPREGEAPEFKDVKYLNPLDESSNIWPPPERNVLVEHLSGKGLMKDEYLNDEPLPEIEDTDDADDVLFKISRGDPEMRESGWIDKEGTIHPKHDDYEEHDTVLRRALENHPDREKIIDPTDAYRAGWISFGHAGYANALGAEKTLRDPHCPATRKLRELFSQLPHEYVNLWSPGSQIEGKHDHKAFVKYGTIKPLGEFGKSEKDDDSGGVKRFYMYRVKDISGVSGTGVVAAGLELPSGICLMEWLTATASLTFFRSMDELRKIHGHEGATEVHYWGDEGDHKLTDKQKRELQKMYTVLQSNLDQHVATFANYALHEGKTDAKKPPKFVFVSCDGDNIGAAVSRAALKDDVAEIKSQDKIIRAGQQVIRRWIDKYQGKLIIDGGDDITAMFKFKRFDYDALKLMQSLAILREAYKKVTSCTLTVGAGAQLSKAIQAMVYGKAHGKDQANLWTKDIGDYVTSQDEKSPEAKYQEEGLLGKYELLLEKAKIFDFKTGKQIADLPAKPGKEAQPPKAPEAPKLKVPTITPPKVIKNPEDRQHKTQYPNAKATPLIEPHSGKGSLKPYVLKIRDGFLVGLEHGKTAHPNAADVHLWLKDRDVYAEPGTVSDLTQRRDLLVDLLSENDPHVQYEINKDGSATRLDSHVMPHPDNPYKSPNYTPPKQWVKDVNYAFTPMHSVTVARYGTPSGNIWVARGKWRDGKITRGISPNRELSRKAAFDRQEPGFTGLHPHIPDVGAESPKGAGDTKLVVGTNVWLRNKIPFFILQNYDPNVLIHPMPGGRFDASAIALSRTKAGEPPIHVHANGENAQEAIDNAVHQLMLEAIDRHQTNQDSPKKAPAADSKEGRIAAKRNMWWTHWIYRQNKISLQDALHSGQPGIAATPPTAPTKKSEELFKGHTTYRAGGIDHQLLINPTGEQARNLAEKSPMMQLRYLKNPHDNKMYMWGAYHMTHADMMREIGIPTSDRDVLENWCGYANDPDHAEDLAGIHLQKLATKKAEIYDIKGKKLADLPSEVTPPAGVPITEYGAKKPFKILPKSTVRNLYQPAYPNPTEQMPKDLVDQLPQPDITSRRGLRKLLPTVKKAELSKEQWNLRGSTPNPLHGWIDPKGTYHHMDPEGIHDEFFRDRGIKTPGSDSEAWDQGWISVGHCGRNEIGMREPALKNPTGPAMHTLRKLIDKHWDSMSFFDGTRWQDDVSVDHFVRHGTVKPVYDIGKTELNKEQWEVEPGNLNPVHGWIDPKGVYHHMEPEENHFDKLLELWPESGDEKDPMTHAYKNGWVSLAHTGTNNVVGHSKSFLDADNPVHHTLRGLVREHWMGPMEMSHENGTHKIDSQHYAKHGRMKKWGEEFDKTELYKHPARGWITPEGRFHPLHPSAYHVEGLYNLIPRKPDQDEIEYHQSVWPNAEKAGYIAIAHAGTNEISGDKRIIGDPSHPANQALRRVMKQHWDSPMIGMGVERFDANHFIKHGTLKPYLPYWKSEKTTVVVPTEPKKSPLKGGRSEGKKLKVNTSELKAGVNIEYEHTNDKKVSERIALDHLDEIPDYYTKLHAMERKKVTLRRLLPKMKKSEDLTKMRGRISFPKLPKLPTRPDQEMHEVSGPSSAKLLRQVLANKMGSDRAKQEGGMPQLDWFLQNALQEPSGIQGATVSGYPYPKKFTLPIQRKPFTSLAFGTTHPVTKEHEGFHHLMNQMRSVHGHDAVSKVLQHLVTYLHPEDLAHMEKALHTRGYSKAHMMPDSWHEELINLTRDASEASKMRELLPMEIIPRIKASWNKMRDESKKIHPGFLMESKRAKKARINRLKTRYIQKQEAPPLNPEKVKSFTEGFNNAFGMTPKPAGTEPKGSPQPTPLPKPPTPAPYQKEEKPATKARGLRRILRPKAISGQDELDKAERKPAKLPKINTRPDVSIPHIPASARDYAPGVAEVQGKGKIVAGPNKGREFRFGLDDISFGRKHAWVRPADASGEPIKPFKAKVRGQRGLQDAYNAKLTLKGKRAKITRMPARLKVQESPSLIDANVHSHKHLSFTPEQRELHHGIDINNLEHLGSGSMTEDLAPMGHGKNIYGRKSIVKGHITTSDADLPSLFDKFTTSHREGLYYNLSKHFFGLDKYVPLTSVFSKNGTHYSAQEWVKAKHSGGNRLTPAFKQMKKNGDIFKVAIMNMIASNRDRHSGNYLMGSDGIHLIDNGFAFSYGDDGFGHNEYPSYITDYRDQHPGKFNDSEKANYKFLGIPKNVRQWASRLDTKKLAKLLKDQKVPAQISKPLLGAMQFAKEILPQCSHLDQFIRSMIAYNEHGDAAMAAEEAHSYEPDDDQSTEGSNSPF